MTSTQPNHVMDVLPDESNFATTIAVEGKTNYGIPLYRPPAARLWTRNLFQDYVYASFNFTTSQNIGTLLFDGEVIPCRLPSNEVSTLPWFLWLISHMQAWQCEFDLVVKFVCHSAHRGSFSATTTLQVPSTGYSPIAFEPIKHFDISGDTYDAEYVVPVPNVYAAGAKFYPDNARFLFTDPRVTLPDYAQRLTWLQLRVVTMLSASSMLPDTITGLIFLRPKPETFKMTNPVLPSFSRYLNTGGVPSTWSNI